MQRKIQCNCPDAINKRKLIPGASSLSLQFDSDWSENFNGIRQNDKYCIHEIATMRARKELELYFVEPPTDMKVPRIDRLMITTKKKKTINGRYGDIF